MLITKEVEIGLKSQTIKWYEDKGYKIPRWINKVGESRVKRGTKITVKVEDLTENSNVKIDVECDGCTEPIIGMNIQNYKRSVKEDGRYFCNKCAKNGYEKWISFFEWCYLNLSKEEADKLLSRWDYELNKVSPKDISRGSVGFNKKGYWFKCLDHLEHISEQKNISAFTNKNEGGEGYIACNQCNSISVRSPHLTKFLVNKEDALKYSTWSNETILLKCPYCGHEKNMKIYTLNGNGFSCPICSDHVPYSEKYFSNFLIQLNVIYKIQLAKNTLKWCNGYRYDFYIENINGIVETHGLQHYEEVKGWGKLSETQENDKVKELLAKENNISNYTILNCKNSNMEWIKNSIMSSNLPQLLNFTESDIDWLKCHEAGVKNLVKEVCENWCNGNQNVLSIANYLKMTKWSVRKYLKQGTQLGWCIPPYNPIVEIEKNIDSISEINSIKIICITTNKIFKSIEEASKTYDVDRASISNCCRNKRKSAGKLPDGTKLQWMYHDKYLENNK